MKPYLFPITIGNTRYVDTRSRHAEVPAGRREFRKQFDRLQDAVLAVTGDDPGCGVRHKEAKKAFRQYRARGGTQDFSAFESELVAARAQRESTTDEVFIMAAYTDDVPVGGVIFQGVALTGRRAATIRYRAYVAFAAEPMSLGAPLLRRLLTTAQPGRTADGCMALFRLEVLDFPVLNVRNRWRSDLPIVPVVLSEIEELVEWADADGYRYPVRARAR